MYIITQNKTLSHHTSYFCYFKFCIYQLIKLDAPLQNILRVNEEFVAPLLLLDHPKYI